MESKEKSKSQTEIKDERQRIMIISVTIVMVAIAALWIFNIKSFINPYSEKFISADQDKLNWKDMKTRFDATMSQVVDKMNEFEAKKELVSNPANASSSLNNLEAALNAKVGGSSSSLGVIVGTSSISQSEDLKLRLDELEKNLEKN
jgi:hypothetical protein